ncbi:PEP/pyruvate-binding domain-containing protein [Streptomyces sp. NPDC048442]|uniref:PEP/pyruvate-binding domain-containing protein n=1 Tax=Streptomyces sp. NPDC048442 TaxID=3154823 RepID=UPI0034318E1E
MAADDTLRSTSSIRPFVMPLDDPAATLDAVGGKGSALAELARGGLPVPGGFHVTTDAYREFVAATGTDERIEAVLAGLDGDDADLAEAAGAQIRGCFRDADIPESLAKAVGSAYEAVGDGTAAMAVRSSATAEDLPGLSFAGQQDTYLNIRGTQAVLEAVRNCWASLWTGRAIHYRARNHISHTDVQLAVVVQELVDADAAGVLFTVDPTTGRTDRLLINAAWGLGEAVVSGLVTPDTVLVDRESGAVVEETIADKTVMTVRTGQGGTHEAPVPEDRRRTAVLSAAEAARLARHGREAEDLYGDPRDIEWARRDGTFYLLQARPITTTAAPAPVPEEWNDSLGTESLWTSANLGEAVPDVMTPATWSYVQSFMSQVMIGATLDGRPMYGNIGGRFYMNLSVTATLAAAFGQTKKFDKATELIFGRLPEGVTVPLLPASRLRIVRNTVSEAFRVTRRVRANGKLLDAFLATAPTRCTDLRERTAAADSPAALRELYDAEVNPYFTLCCHMLQAATRQDGDMLIKVRGSLRDLAGEADADLMTTGLTADGGQLASMGPLLGLEQLAAGTLDRATYLRTYGHRSPHEFEVSRPRPAEDPDWIDTQLAALDRVEENAELRLGRQDSARKAAWSRFEAAHPQQAAPMREAVRTWSESARLREAARTEIARVFWLLRTFVVRAGELTGDGEELFFLHAEEIRALLTGERDVLEPVPARRAAYESYSALPPYPTLIRGHFDPARWAADPDRRADFHDAHTTTPAAASETVTGSPASAGVVEGIARVIATVEEGDRLQPGEILVTTVTNIGWTPLFTRISAIVTDVGANLSHASIVARELGIPAVVGCGNATTRLHTGDRIRVDGGRGTVEIVQR